NILDNGDFRLKTIPFGDFYSLSLNKEGWVLVNAGYAITEAFEVIDEDNIAYKITSGLDSSTANAGKAYIQSESYFVSMGTNNQLLIKLRSKVDRISASFGISVYTVEVPYIKVRVRIKYG